MPWEVAGSPALRNDSLGRATAGTVEFVTAADFRSKVLNASGPVVVEFMSFACGYCRKANPMVHDVASGLQNRVKVYQVNVPMDPELTQKYKVRGTPTFVMFQNGQEVGRSNPELTPAAIRSAILAPFGG
jgi:thioredoxin 1